MGIDYHQLVFVSGNGVKPVRQGYGSLDLAAVTKQRDKLIEHGIAPHKLRVQTVDRCGWHVRDWDED